MWTLGIDIAKVKHNASLLDEEGRIFFNNLSFTNDDEGLQKLLSRISQSGMRHDQIVVGMESTGHYWMLLFQHLTAAGFEVRVINPLVIRARGNIGIRGSRTDSIASLAIARYLREIDLKKSALPEQRVAELRTLTRLRYELSQELVAQKLRLIGLLDLVFPEYGEHFSDIFGVTSRQVLTSFPTAKELAQVDVRRLTNLLQKASRGRMGRDRAEALKRAAQNSFARHQANKNLELQIRFLVERLNLTIVQIEELDREIETYFPEEQKLLLSLPGIGPVWGPTILAEILPVFDPERRDGGTAFVAMAGIDPKLNQSGKKNGKTTMSKRGSKYLRTALMEAASVAVTKTDDPMFGAIYEKQIVKNKPYFVAVSHVANKMCHVIFAVLKNKCTYEPRI